MMLPVTVVNCRWEDKYGVTGTCEGDVTQVISVGISGTYAHSGYCHLHIEEAKSYTYTGSAVYTLDEWKVIWGDTWLESSGRS